MLRRPIMLDEKDYRLVLMRKKFANFYRVAFEHFLNIELQKMAN